MSISKAGAGLIVFILGLIGVQVGEGETVEFISAILTIVGFVGTVIGQLDRKDLKWGLVRKEK